MDAGLNRFVLVPLSAEFTSARRRVHIEVQEQNDIRFWQANVGLLAPVQTHTLREQKRNERGNFEKKKHS